MSFLEHNLNKVKAKYYLFDDDIKNISIIYLTIADILISINLTTKITTVELNTKMLPADSKDISYEDLINLLTENNLL